MNFTSALSAFGLAATVLAGSVALPAQATAHGATTSPAASTSTEAGWSRDAATLANIVVGDGAVATLDPGQTGLTSFVLRSADGFDPIRGASQFRLVAPSGSTFATAGVTGTFRTGGSGETSQAGAWQTAIAPGNNAIVVVAPDFSIPGSTDGIEQGTLEIRVRLAVGSSSLEGQRVRDGRISFESGPVSGLHSGWGYNTTDSNPAATVSTATLQRGESAEVTATFNKDARGREVRIMPPAGTAITGTTDAAFAVSEDGLSGVLPASQDRVVFTLRAADDASSGPALGGVVRAMKNSEFIGIGEWQARIAEPEAPAQDVALTSHVGGVAMTPGKPVFSGAGEPGATVEVISWWGDNVGSTVVEDSGTWTIVWNKALKSAHYTGGVARQHLAGELHSVSVPYNFVVREDLVVYRDVRVVAPSTGGSVPAGAPVFSGTGEPDATVRIVSAWGFDVGSAIVSPEGEWRIEWNKSLVPGSYVGGVTKQIIGGVTQSFERYDFTVVK